MEEADENRRVWLQSRHTERMRDAAGKKTEWALDALLKACQNSEDPNIRVLKAKLEAAKALQVFLNEGKL